jgi:CubicO group peptidase (beta-lactamase class C family)
MLKTRAVLAPTLLVAGLACSESDPTKVNAGPPNFDPFDQAIEAAIAAHNQANPTQPIQGASAAIVDREHGLVHSKGYGAFAPDRLYMVASASKVLSTGVLMRLADQGMIDLDKPISTYLGAWGQHKTNVTTTQLLSNSSGLPSLEETVRAFFDRAPEALLRFLPHYCQFQAAGSLATCAQSIYSDDHPANNRPPDEVFRYGGSQWQLVGGLAEQVSGKSWGALVAETYAACDVRSIGYTNQFQESPLAYPPKFQANAANATVTANPSIEGGGYITAPDYAKVLLMHLRGGKCGSEQVLSEAAVARMEHDRVSGADGYAPEVGTGANVTDGSYRYPGYGLGWWVDAPNGFITDPGAYGAYPTLDRPRGYASLILVEMTPDVGKALADATRPVLISIYDAL